MKALLIFCAFGLFGASCLQQAGQSPVKLTASETPDPVPERVSSTEFEAFSHKIPDHQQFACVSCHQREGRSLEMAYTGHESCVGCHLNEFIDKEDKTRAMCAVCHTDVNAADPPVKPFPTKFAEGFNTKFDHADHDNGAGRPANGCAACHTPSGPGKTIPANFQAHATCFACHTAESEIGSCSVCHEIAPYQRTLQSQYSPRIIFRHGDHTGQSCNECHRITPGAPQGRQVSSIATREHKTTPGFNCLQCHNGSRAFNGNNALDIRSCVRCHSGPGFGALPAGSYNAEAAPEAPSEE